METVARAVLCENRHAIEGVEDNIFPAMVNPVDVNKLETLAYLKIKSLQCTTLHLYVTGLTPALIATLNAARALNVTVVCWHYNKYTNDYFSQLVK